MAGSGKQATYDWPEKWFKDIQQSISEILHGVQYRIQNTFDLVDN